jgi:hypothetical protein
MSASKNKWNPLLILLIFVISCTQSEVKYKGLNDLVVGIQTITLYENGEFYLEMGLGGAEGTYNMSGDTIVLDYNDKPSDNWPENFLMRDNYFESINADSSISKTKIDRVK